MADTITLKHPVEFKGDQVTELRLRRPKGRDLKQLQDVPGGEAARTYRLMADLADVDPDLIDELDVADIAQLSEHLAAILPKAPSSPS